MKKQYVYSFKEGRADMKKLLGGKGANLAEMVNIGLPVPDGFTVTTEACRSYYKNGKRISDEILFQINNALKKLEKDQGKKLGDTENPLLVSVRSGAAISMPGMMDTILNLGLNDKSVLGLAASTNNERFAYDSYRRFIQMFGDVVLNIDHDKFEAIIEEEKVSKKVKSDTELEAKDWKNVIKKYKKLINDLTGLEFPQDPKKQLYMAIEAVFSSWNNDRAKIYRKVNKIPNTLGTAVNVQTMVFGNKGEDCGTGVAFTRNPSTGDNKIYGEFLLNAQGEDVVAGIRTPRGIEELEKLMPNIYKQFVKTCDILENHYRDMQDIEFTIENGKLYILQTRCGKRTAQAAVKIAVDMVKEGLIDTKEALLRVSPDQLVTLLHRRIDPNVDYNIVANGLPASPGAASGRVIFNANEAEKLGNEGENIILVRNETTPDDIHGIIKSVGVLTSRGGMTSHAAVVARGMGIPCVTGCHDIDIDYEKEEFTVGDIVVRKGDIISIDGASGKLILGEVSMIEPVLSSEFKQLLTWADKIRKLKVRANADTPKDVNMARDFGAEGVGLCRTEHMFMAPDRLPIVQQMIMADTEKDRKKALSKLLLYQKRDFEEIFKALNGLPATIRLLDPPLHEFLPDTEELLLKLVEEDKAKEKNKDLDKDKEMLNKARNLKEVNPMLGLRGCRLGLMFPEIYEMQVEAIITACCSLIKKGMKVNLEIEIPLVGHVNELERLRNIVSKKGKEVMQKEGINFTYKIGTMIELPRACITADKVAQYADFFSFGTNDLTQTTFGFSRDDAEAKFLPHYIDENLLRYNPFIVLDRDGVGYLMKLAVKLARKEKKEFLIGICGEHGGEPSSIEFCHLIGLDFVSCSPYRVPIARLAAAQAVLKEI